MVSYSTQKTVGVVVPVWPFVLQLGQ